MSVVKRGDASSPAGFLSVTDLTPLLKPTVTQLGTNMTKCRAAGRDDKEVALNIQISFPAD